MRDCGGGPKLSHGYVPEGGRAPSAARGGRGLRLPRDDILSQNLPLAYRYKGGPPAVKTLLRVTEEGRFCFAGKFTVGESKIAPACFLIIGSRSE